ncbi:MAG: phosphotransferase [Pseudomonadota bacterium]
MNEPTLAAETLEADDQRWLEAALKPRQLERIEALPVAASQRRFYRVYFLGTDRTDRTARDAFSAGRAVLMRSPPTLERNDAFQAMNGLFRGAGVAVPAILAKEEHRGLFLLSDLGPRSLGDCYGTDEEGAAVNAAIDTLQAIQGITDATLEPYTRDRLQMELGIFEAYAADRVLNTHLSATLRTLFERLVDSALDQPQRCIHRDYHSLNLLWNDAALGVVDYQDALLGPHSYDAASLLHDCYHQFSAAALERYRDRARATLAPTLATEDWQRQLEWMAIQRQLKAVGIFLRLELRDGRDNHLHHVLPTLSKTQALARHYAELEPLARWLEAQHAPMTEWLRARGERLR